MSDQPETPQSEDSAGETRPMQPMDSSVRHGVRSLNRARAPIQAKTEDPEPPDFDPFLPSPDQPRAGHREADPIVAYLLIISLGIGISPLDAQVRYVLLWILMAVLGTMAYLLGGVQRMREATLDDLLWGITFGIVSSFPFLLVFGSSLETVSTRMFDANDTPPMIMNTWVLMAVAFVIPLSETLFFRGAMQGVRSLFLTTALATLWSAVLFFPHMELGGSEAIGGIMLIVFLLLNFMFSYVRHRNGLAAAWLCQVTSYTMLWMVPRLLF